MSVAHKLYGTTAMFSSKERLTKALKDNRNNYTISRDGYVSLNMNNADVVKALEEQIKKMANIQEEPQRQRN
ncbi:hypothetical protein ACMGGR_09000 [Erwinia sp. BNK-24-b]|uniref:hypothetical protein n=1 Tax=Erwinia TaxID=551 RepID=UPI001FEDB5EA|nr:hypothetical protein [Erwinia phyllosphaerae]MBV4366934.1 hypothetical protein [Erwinia phyllosphaerae]